LTLLDVKLSQVDKNYQDLDNPYLKAAALISMYEVMYYLIGIFTYTSVGGMVWAYNVHNKIFFTN